MMDPGSFVRTRGEYFLREIAGETILVPVRSGVAELDSAFTLNKVASVLWTGIKEERSFRDIVAGIVSQFDVSEESATHDLEEFIAILQDRGLIDIVRE